MSELQIEYDQSDSLPVVFYFKSCGRTVGEASNLKELAEELTRLEYEDPGTVRYHLVEGHIVRWLRSINENELADRLDGVVNVTLAKRFVEKQLEKSLIVNRMRNGRMC